MSAVATAYSGSRLGRSRHPPKALILALGVVLALVSCKSDDDGGRAGGRAGVGSSEAAGQAPGASRAELARVPPEFPLPDADPRALDVVTSERDGKETVRLSFSAPGRPAQAALLLSDHLAAFGWTIPLLDESEDEHGSSFDFQGFGWSGKAEFAEGEDDTTAVTVEMTESRP